MSKYPYGYIVSYVTAKGMFGYQQFTGSTPWGVNTAAKVLKEIAANRDFSVDQIVITSVFAFDVTEES